MLRVICNKCFFFNTTVFIVLVSKNKKINEIEFHSLFFEKGTWGLGVISCDFLFSELPINNSVNFDL